MEVKGTSTVDWVLCALAGCGKSRVRENMVASKDGKRFYCSDRHKRQGERKYGAKGA